MQAFGPARLGAAVAPKLACLIRERRRKGSHYITNYEDRRD